MSTAGVVFLDKPEGWASRRAVDAVARLYAGGGRPPRAGHTGTLDPMATGMLPILLGEATRLASLGSEADKRYRFAVDFSITTGTLDREGEVVARHDAGGISREALEEALRAMLGEQEQVPPAFSAVRVRGERAYRLARAGREVAPPPRRVVIRELELVAWTPPVAELECLCSKGTFVRAIARDLGARLGAGGTVVALRRRSTGGWPETVMRPWDEIRAHPERHLLPVEVWVSPLPRIVLGGEQARRLALGQRLAGFAGGDEGTHAAFWGERLLGIVRRDARGVLHPEVVLASVRAALLGA